MSGSNVSAIEMYFTHDFFVCGSVLYSGNADFKPFEG